MSVFFAAYSFFFSFSFLVLYYGCYEQNELARLWFHTMGPQSKRWEKKAKSPKLKEGGCRMACIPIPFHTWLADSRVVVLCEKRGEINTAMAFVSGDTVEDI